VTFKNKQVVITGGLGFIGSSLARKLLEQGAAVTLIDSLVPQYGGNLYNVEDIKNRLRINISDVRDPYSLAFLLKDKDYLFNLAGQTSHMDSMSDPHSDLNINAGAQLSILETCRTVAPNIRVVFASTRQLYGKPEYLPVDENHPIKPVDVNGINKLAGEMYHLLYSKVYNIPCTVLRLTNTYGPGMRIKDARQTFLGIWIRQLIEGSTIKVFGSGQQLRDFNYVDDVVDAMLEAALNDKAIGEVFNLGSSEIIDLKSLATQMVALFGHGQFEMIPFPADRKAIDIGDYYSDYTKAKTVLDWSPSVDLATGISLTLTYYRENFKHYVE
jgi:UDP-glucose 4-epimerase